MVKFIPKQKEETKPVTHKVGQCYIDKDGDVIMLCWMDGKGNFLQVLTGECAGETLRGDEYAFKVDDDEKLSQKDFELLYNKQQCRLTPINIEIHEV